MRVAGYVLALAALLGGCAATADLGATVGYADDGTPIYGQSFAPTDRDGYVLVECTALNDGRVADCAVVEERPAGSGMAEVALRSAVNARLDPNAAGFKAGGKVRFPLRFREN